MQNLRSNPRQSFNRNARASQPPGVLEVRPIYANPAPHTTADTAPPKKKQEIHVLPDPAISSSDPTFYQTSGLWLIQVDTNEDPGIKSVTIYHPTLIKKVATAIFRTYATCANTIQGLIDQGSTLRVVTIEIVGDGAVPEYALALLHSTDRSLTPMYYLGNCTYQL
jgi:hypothetical protein